MIRELIKERNDRIDKGYSEIDPKDIPNEKIKIHSCFDIKCPDAYLDDIEKYLILQKQDVIPIFISKRQDINEIENIVDCFLELYQYEVGTIKNPENYKKDIEKFFLISSAILDERLKITDKFKYVGIIIMVQEQIDIVWIHPYFRNKGIMTYFAMQLLEEEKPISVSEPISKPMLDFLKSFQKKIELDEKLKDKFRKAILIKFIKILGKDDDFIPALMNFNFEEAKKLSTGYNNFKENFKELKLSPKDIKENIKMMIATHFLIHKNMNEENRPMIESLLDNPSISEIDKTKRILEILNS